MHYHVKQRVCLKCEKVFTPVGKFNFLCPACLLAAKTMGGDYLVEGNAFG